MLRTIMPGMALPIVLLWGCATIVEGNDQTVSIVTEPAGAACELTREGHTVGFVNPTPGSINLEKSSDHIAVRCEKEGHFAGAGVLASGFQGMTFGNILFGGIIGVAVDSASGAMHEYPPSVTVVLVPKRFAEVGERDEFFGRQAQRIKTEAATAIVEAREICVARHSDQASRRQDCDKLVKAIENERDARLEELESRRMETTVE